MTKKANKGIPEELVEKRYICSVLDDMRDCHKTRNYGPLKGLVEEAQAYASRMEDGLHASRDSSHAIYTELKSETPDLDRVRELLNKRWNFKNGSRWSD